MSSIELLKIIADDSKEGLFDHVRKIEGLFAAKD